MRALLGAVILLLTGCSTLTSIGSRHDEFFVYSGTFRNLMWLTPPPPRAEDSPEGSADRTCEQVAAAVDLPLSFVLDTVLLPLSVPVTLLR